MYSARRCRSAFCWLVTAILVGTIAGCGGSSSHPIVVTMTQGANVSLDNGQTKNLAVTVTNDSKSAGVAWALASGPGTLSGATTSAVTYNAPASGAAATATVTATSITDTTKSAAITIHIAPVPTIATTPAPGTGTNGSAFSYAVPVSGGTAPLSWSISVGALPTGLTLSQSGTISGIPNANATSSPYTFTVRVQDAATVAATQDYSLTIDNPPAPVISTTAPTAGTNGTAYSAFTFTLASGGLAPFSWSETGALPTGMTLSTGGVLSGTPHEAGSFPITVLVQDHSNPQQTASHSFTIQINNPPAPTITTTSLPNGTVGTPYNQTIQATAGLAPYSWSVSAGTLPAGLNLGSSTTNAVTISGTPTAAASSTFTIQIMDAASQPGTQAYTVVMSNPPAPSITTTSLPDGAVGTPYNQTIHATGGLAPFTWSMTSGNPPAGLTLDTSSTTNSITLSGTPTTIQSNVLFTVQIVDSLSQIGAQGYAMNIAAQPIIVTITNKMSTIQAGASAVTLNATVQHDTQGVTWTLTANGSDCSPTCGTLSNSTSNSVDYTPPATVPSAPDNAPTITAVSVTDITKTDTDSFTITSATAACSVQGNEAVLNGQYAFSLAGFNGTGFGTLAGSLTVNGAGHITAGVVDTNGALGLHTQVSIDTAASSYSVGSDNRGCLAIATSSGTFPMRIAVGGLSSNVATKGRIMEWDAPLSSASFIATGQLLKQTTSAFSGGLSGGYVFSVAGFDLGTAARMTCTGVLPASGGTFSAGEQDCNDGADVAHETGITGTYSALDFSGRGTGTLVTSNGTSHIAVYMVSSSKLLMLGIDSSGTPIYSGEIRSQSGTFGSSSLNAKAIYYLTGTGPSGQRVDIGTFTGNGSGSANGTAIEDDAGTLTQQPDFTCNYTVASNGRVALTGANCGNHNPVLYLTAANTGFMEGTGNSIQVGPFEPQTGGPFSNSTVSGTFFTGTTMVTYQAESDVGSISLTNGTVTGTSDDIGAGDQTEGRTFTDSITIAADGSFSTEGGAINAYVISPSKFVVIDAAEQSTTSVMVGEK